MANIFLFFIYSSSKTRDIILAIPGILVIVYGSKFVIIGRNIYKYKYSLYEKKGVASVGQGGYLLLNKKK